MELQQPLHHQYDSYFVREIIDFYSLLSTDKTDHIFVYFHKVITTAMKKKKKKRTPKQKQPYYLCFDDDLTEELFTTLRTRCIILNKNKPFFDVILPAIICYGLEWLAIGVRQSSITTEKQQLQTRKFKKDDAQGLSKSYWTTSQKKKFLLHILQLLLY